jgi:hypothetical protein
MTTRASPAIQPRLDHGIFLPSLAMLTPVRQVVGAVLLCIAETVASMLAGHQLCA